MKSLKIPFDEKVTRQKEEHIRTETTRVGSTDKEKLCKVAKGLQAHQLQLRFIQLSFTTLHTTERILIASCKHQHCTIS